MRVFLTFAALLSGCVGDAAERGSLQTAAKVVRDIKSAPLAFDPVYECADGWSFWMYEKAGARVVTLVDRTSVTRVLQPTSPERFANEQTIVELSTDGPDTVTLTADGRPTTLCRRSN